MKSIFAAAAFFLTAAPALAQPSNLPPPANPAFQLAGLPVPAANVYQQYSFSFVAGSALTNLTFAFRHDPAFMRLDDVSLSTGGGANLVVNGGFELGVNGAQPVGWTYANEFGSVAGGLVLGGNQRTGSLYYRSGSVQAYDAITQAIATVIGTTYDVSFWAASSDSADVYRALSTNGNVTNIGGNARNIAVYAQQGIPAPGNAVPEPGTWAMMIVGFGLVGGAMRRRAVKVAFAA